MQFRLYFMVFNKNSKFSNLTTVAAFTKFGKNFKAVDARKLNSAGCAEKYFYNFRLVSHNQVGQSLKYH